MEHRVAIDGVILEVFVFTPLLHGVSVDFELLQGHFSDLIQGVQTLVEHPLAFAVVLCNVKCGHIVAMRHKVEVLEVDKVLVEIEVLAKLAVGHPAPIVKLHCFSVVVLNSTAPLVCHFSNRKFVAVLGVLRSVQIPKLHVEVVMVVVNVHTEASLWGQVKCRCELKVCVDLDSAIFSKN